MGLTGRQGKGGAGCPRLLQDRGFLPPTRGKCREYGVPCLPACSVIKLKEMVTEAPFGSGLQPRHSFVLVLLCTFPTYYIIKDMVAFRENV